ncbi:multidrug effflux MFS transporter [Lutibaculum baratangense]|nr:multidrug effflux MFS transporter [Lutibaculum baratangense]
MRSAPGFPEFVAMIASMMALTALSIDVMLPALPQIESEFDVGGANNQQLVVTLYVLGFAAGQLFYGPLSDRFGRKPVLLGGLLLYAAASVMCMLAHTFELLLAARFLQGIANASPRIIAIAVVRDIYGGRRMAEVMSFVMMVFIIVPVIAPSIGGAFLMIGSWHLIFGALAVISLAVLVWTTLRLGETRPPESREPLSVAWLVKAFGETLSNRQTLGYTLAIGTIFGSMMSYINSAQQVFMEVYGAGAWFPVLFGAVAGALAVASFVNSRLVVRVGMRRLSHAALVGFTATAIVHLAVYFLLGPPSLWLFVILMAIGLFCFGFVMPNFNALAMEPMGHIAGTASSFVGAVMTGLAAALGWYVGQHYDGTIVPLVTGFAAFGIASLAIVAFTERGRLFGVGSGQ